MIEIKVFELFFIVALLSIFISDLYKGILMVFTDQTPLLFIAQISFFLLKFLPKPIRDDRYSKAINTYIKRKKIYGSFMLLGGIYGILLLVAIVVKNL